MPEHLAPRASDPQPADDVQSGRSRLFQALRKPGRGQIVVAVLLAVVGFAMVIEVRANQVDNTYAGQREEDLINIFEGLNGTVERARREITRLEDTKADLQTDTSARRAALAESEERLRTLNILAGFVPVQGPGIHVVMTEGEKTISITTLLDTVQELRTAGAEAMEFNDRVRVVAQTSFATTDEGIVVDGVLLKSPYTLDVIGLPRALEGAMTFNDGPEDQLRNNDLAEVVTTQEERVVITSVRDESDPKYARPSTGQ